eukprot:TRINITY_DN23602_c0_g1_i1.p1 TRINITY_DN23602_c0_g1~~TRINITY_DN23602_c0_g1_i1.p1  ORF type:complete len:185 (-),score=21.45 TRINITY_DN23602_c0_g1_i1:12-566(-)
MKHAIISAFIAICIVFGASQGFAQKNKGGATAGGTTIGIVDVETIVKEMPDAISADKKLKDIGQKWQDTLMGMRKDLETKYQQYQKQKSMMPADQQQKEEESLQKLNQQMMQYNEMKFGQQGELNVMKEQFLQPIRAKVLAAIETVAKEEGISMVMEKGTNVLYSEAKMDITFRVIDRMKRGEK